MSADMTITAPASFEGPLSSSAVILTANELLAHQNNMKNGVQGFDALKFMSSTATLASDTLALAVLNVTRYITVDTEGAAATDNLSTITGGSDGQMLLLYSANAARVITVKHSTGNIRLAGGGSDTVLRATVPLMLFYNSSAGFWAEVGSLPAMTINSSRTVLGADAGTWVISSIPSTYKHLMLVLELRTDNAATFDSILLRFNADATAANYYSQLRADSAAAVNAAEILGSGSTGVAINSGAVGNTGSAGNSVVVVWLFNYNSTTMRKAIMYQSFVHGGNTTGLLRSASGGGDWTNTANAISSITILPNAGSNLKQNSAYTLYGMN